MQDESNQETEQQIKEIKDIASKKGDKVVDDLVNAVVDVITEPPTNVEVAQ